MAMNKDAEEAAVQRLEALMDEHEGDPDAFEEDPEPGGHEVAQRLGAVVSVRFDDDDADRLRALGTQLGVPYTSLVRRFVQERLAELEGAPLPATTTVTIQLLVTPTGEVTVLPKAS